MVPDSWQMRRMIFHLYFLTGNHLLHANDGRRAQTHDGSIAEEGEKAPWQGPQEKLSDLTSGKALEKSRQFCRSLAQVHMDSPVQFLGTNFQHVTKHKNCFNDSGLGNLHEFKSWAFYFWPAWLIKLVGKPRWSFDSVQGDHRVKDDKRISHFLKFDSVDLRFLAFHCWTIRSQQSAKLSGVTIHHEWLPWCPSHV